MSKYNVGDIVRVRDDLNTGCYYGANSVVADMLQYCGQEAKIIEVADEFYKINLDNEDWFWTDEMFKDCVDSALDEEKAQTVDIGYYLEYCGHKIIKNVYYGGYAHDLDHVFCTTINNKNQYTLPVDSIEFIVPHED